MAQGNGHPLEMEMPAAAGGSVGPAGIMVVSGGTLCFVYFGGASADTLANNICNTFAGTGTVNVVFDS